MMGLFNIYILSKTSSFACDMVDALSLFGVTSPLSWSYSNPPVPTLKSQGIKSLRPRTSHVI